MSHPTKLATLCAVASLFLWCGCTDDSDLPGGVGGGDDYITFGTHIGSVSAASTRAVDQSWSAGDEVGVFMTKDNYDIIGDAGNKLYTAEVEESVWTLTPSGNEDKLHYPSSGDVRFVAYYPYKSDISFTKEYPVALGEQTNSPAFDLLWYKDETETGLFNKNSSASLQFEHQLSKIVVNVNTKGFTADDLRVSLTNVPTTADFNVKTGALTNLGNKGTVILAAATPDTSDENLSETESRSDETTSSPLAYQGIIVPHKASDPYKDRYLTFSFTDPITGEDAELTHLIKETGDDAHNFVKNTISTYTVTLTHKEVILNNVSIKDWDEGNEEDAVLTPVEGSNCYIVPTNSALIFPVKHACRFYRELADFENNAALLSSFLGENESFVVDVLWSDTYSGSTAPSGTGIAKSDIVSATSAVADVQMVVPGHNGQILVKTGNKEGNAVVALRKTADGDILFSWHIWVTDFDPEATKKTDSKNGYTWMDRNLGATSNQDNTVGALGLLYQWGRKDPFPGSKDYTTVNTAPIWYHTVSDIYEKVVITDRTMNDSRFMLAGPKNVSVSLSSPICFLYNSSSGGDWCNNPDNYSSPFRWFNEREKALDDPCPPGWKVPWAGRENTYVSPWLGWNTHLDFEWSSTVDNYGRGTVDDSLGWWPAAGFRSPSTGALGNMGTHGYYWSATRGIDGAARHLHFYNTYVNTHNGNKSNGYSVRCVPQ